MNNHSAIFFIVFAIIAILNRLVRKGGMLDGGKPPTTNRTSFPPRDVQAQQSEEERLRKFMEALGVPANTAQTRQIVRPQVQTVPRAQSPVRRLPATRQVVARKVPSRPPVSIPQPVPASSSYEAENVGARQVESTAVYTSGATTAAVTAAAPAVVELQPSARVDFRALVKSPSSIRTAIVLKEILGPPRGLQPMGSSFL